MHTVASALARMTRRAECAGALIAALLVVGGCATATRPGDGTMAPYSVGGRTYVPVREWRGYTEEGFASWYGPGYHGRPTASGERFDTNTMTAAHPVLPMQVCLRVHNLENDRVATVRVNDRGPFKDGRVVDLSLAAARALDMLARGTARVRLTAVALADPAGRCPPGASAARRAPGAGLTTLAWTEPRGASLGGGSDR